MRSQTLLAFACTVTSLAASQSAAPKPSYDFALTRQQKIELAESAAPKEVSGKATVYSLEQKGYIKVRDGSNGFTCIVNRQTPLNSEPTCFDAEGSATTLQVRLFVEEERARGRSEEQIDVALTEGYNSGK